jgi:hypothetical protein
VLGLENSFREIAMEQQLRERLQDVGVRRRDPIADRVEALAMAGRDGGD